jgi:hypothetical protein
MIIGGRIVDQVFSKYSVFEDIKKCNAAKTRLSFNPTNHTKQYF